MAPNDTVFQSAYAAFLGEHPGYNAEAIDALRAGGYERLDRHGHVYLDYTGAGLYSAKQVEEHRALLLDGIFGNPHSHNPSAMDSTHGVEAAREAVHEYFNASPDEYEVIFTANASGALKLIGESYPFTPKSCYLVSYDNHNSVNGIREFARCKGAKVTYVPVRNPDLRLDTELIERGLSCAEPDSDNLFAYPAQSNFSGVQHPLEWIAEAQSRGWDVLLDAAAFVPTNRLDLSVIKPDFVPVSFYKMFGYPTGAGVLIAKREKLAKLKRPWFAGGTITLASVQGEGWYHLAAGATGFEDGTVDFLGLPGVTIGLKHLAAVGVGAVHERVSALAGWLLERMTSMRHGNGAPMVQIFGPETMDRRGATIAFYLLDPTGAPYDVYGVEREAGSQGISVRTGCFCNPGDGEVAHNITREEMAECFETPAVPVTLQHCQSIIQDATGKAPNTIRISLGLASNFADVWRFVTFAETFRDRVR